MALLECTDCGGQVSDRAGSCPLCGCPVEIPQPGKLEAATGIAPLVTVSGRDVSLLQQEPLEGVCPKCHNQTTFEVLSLPDFLDMINQSGTGGGFKSGLISGLLADASNLLRGHKIPYTYTCTNCEQHFYVCRDCMRPTEVRAGPETRYCDYCRP